MKGYSWLDAILRSAEQRSGPFEQVTCLFLLSEPTANTFFSLPTPKPRPSSAVQQSWSWQRSIKDVAEVAVALELFTAICYRRHAYGARCEQIGAIARLAASISAAITGPIVFYRSGYAEHALPPHSLLTPFVESEVASGPVS